MTAILGLNAYHGDAAAAIVVDGELVAAAEEERFSRVKHVAGFPALAAAWCLKEAGLDASELDHIAVSRDPRANVGQGLLRYGDEGKVMGLASYGDPAPNMRAMREALQTSGALFALNLDYFRHDKEGVD